MRNHFVGGSVGDDWDDDYAAADGMRMAPMRTVMIVPGDSQGDGVVVAMV